MYLLWQFKNLDGNTMVTRGVSSGQAAEYLYVYCGERNIELQSFCDIRAAYVYSSCHPFDWINNPPRWLSPKHKWLQEDLTFKDKFYK